MGGYSEREDKWPEAQFMGRLITKGFQEEESPQSDLPSMLRESLKMYFAVAANEGFGIWSSIFAS